MIYCQKTLLRELDDCRKRNNANRNSCYPTHIAEWQKFAEETSLVQLKTLVRTVCFDRIFLQMNLPLFEVMFSFFFIDRHSLFHYHISLPNTALSHHATNLGCLYSIKFDTYIFCWACSVSSCAQRWRLQSWLGFSFFCQGTLT